MAHPQSSPRGLWAKQNLNIGSSEFTYNSTAVRFSKGLSLSGKSVVLTMNTTAVISSGGMAFSGVAAKTITANSTGIRIGSLYISCNSTGNTTT